MNEAQFELENVTAIDSHVHIQVDDSGHHGASDAQREAMSRYFRRDHKTLNLDETAAHYRERSMLAVVFTVDATTNSGRRPNSIDDIVSGAQRNADVLIPFGSVDPLQGSRAVDEVARQVDLGVRGFKFHPTTQGFDPSNAQFDPIFAAIEERSLPVIVHTGHTGVGAGVPGGLGLKLAYSNPMLLDTVAANHPGLQIVMAHPSFPWQDEALSVATHKQNVWIDLSGWSPKYFPPELIRAVRTYLKDRVLFGSDFPMLTSDRWLKDFGDLGLDEDVLSRTLKDNAVRLLQL